MTVQPDEVGVETEEPEVEETEEPEDKPDEKEKDAGEDKPDAGGASKKAVTELKGERERRRKAEDELRRLKAESATDAEKAINSAVEQNDEKWAGRVKTMASRLALAEAGVAGDKLARAARLLDGAALEVTDNGDVTGLEEEVESLKEQWPDLFEDPSKSNGKAAPKVRAPGAQGTGTTKKSSAQRLADQLLGNK